jgi:ABC-type multidrug transport system fused ATPase/permease subunit
MIKQLIELWGYFSSDRKRQFYLLFFSMVVASISEIISLGSILPFLGALLSPETILRFPIVAELSEYISFGDSNEVMILATGIFAAAAITAGLFRLHLLYSINKFSFAVGADLSGQIYKKTLLQPYFKHALVNTSDVISSVTSRTNTVIFNIVLNSQIFLSSIVLLVLISMLLILIEPKISGISFVLFSSIYIVIAWYTKKIIGKDSEIISRESAKSLQALQEGLGGIRDVILDGNQDYFYRLYKKSDTALRKAQARVQFVIGSPRFIVEALGMMLIAMLLFFLTKKDGGVALAIPLLGVLVMGAQRMLPLLQQTYSAYSAMRAGQASLNEILKLMRSVDDQVELRVERMTFDSSLEVVNMSFNYYEASTQQVLKGINLKILKGTRVGIIGKTGSGKSTLIDLLMGLLTPSNGSIAIDGMLLDHKNIRAWQNIVAHVPQNIYLSDGTIEENIAFGIPAEKIDKHLVREVAMQAQLTKLIKSWPNEFLTRVGENGARLSGGQRQRIAIARALYKKAKVIIFDEATSALDVHTERAVIKSIYDIHRDITLIMVAHRATTLSECDSIYEILDGQISPVKLAE